MTSSVASIMDMDPLDLFSSLYALQQIADARRKDAFARLVRHAGGRPVRTPAKKRSLSPDTRSEEGPDTPAWVEKGINPIFFSGHAKIDLRSDSERVASGEHISDYRE